MKKFLILLLTLTIAIFCAGCGTFTPPIITNPGNTGEGGNNTPIDPDIDPDAFTVVLLRESGARFYPTPDMNIKAAWTGQGESYSASFGVNGIAAISGLDGTYNVSLTNVPEGYTFDPNQDYSVNNNNRLKEITLMAIMSAAGEGTGFYDGKVKQITNTGLYRAEFKNQTEAERGIYYSFEPNTSGTYCIESFVNVQENAVNPILNYYISNGAWVNEANPEVYDSGGPSGSFTKNFKFYADKVSGFTGVWGLVVRASVQSGHTYPVYVDFRISYLQSSPQEGVNVKANGPYADDTTGKPSSNNFNYIYAGEEGDKKYYIDDYKVKFNSKDGFYHVLPQSEYNKEDSAIDWTICPVLYARIFKDSEIDPTNGEGLMWHRAHTISPTEQDSEHTYTNGICALCGMNDGEYDTNALSLILGSRTYYGFVHTYYKSIMAYPTMKDKGTVPVNAEIQRFLEDFAKYNERPYGSPREGRTEPLFDDGAGRAEVNFGVAGPDSIWLFCCGYFGNTPIAYPH